MRKRGAVYNEIDKYAAQWLRNLIAANLIAPGDVDERDIRDVHPDDYRGYVQCHFFAGIGVWSYALRNAGWEDTREVWTGSCPCQPFSAAGKGAGFADERHLFPHWFYLIEKRRPAIVFGEQVASKDGLAWLDDVQNSLEGADYAFGAADTCSAGVGAPHIRQRLRFVAHSADGGRQRRRPSEQSAPHRSREFEQQGFAGALADVQSVGWVGRSNNEDEGRGQLALGRDGTVGGFWRDADWIFCTDNKWRAVEPGSFPLAHGAPARVGRLRAYGNAVDAEATRVFIEAYIETQEIAAEEGALF